MFSETADCSGDEERPLVANETSSVSADFLDNVNPGASPNQQVAASSDEFLGEHSHCSDSEYMCKSSNSDSNASEHNTLEGTSKSVCEKLANWSVEYKISHAALSALLSILRSELPDLPKDSRTLLSTQTLTNTKIVADGEYYHFGIKSGMISKLALYPSFTTKVFEKSFPITLQINIDGLPIAKSNSKQFWPILGMIDQLPKKDPFLIGLYFGVSKPSDIVEFLDDFIGDMKKIQSEGVYF